MLKHCPKNEWTECKGIFQWFDKLNTLWCLQGLLSRWIMKVEPLEMDEQTSAKVPK
jgi:hypothetical protein